MEASVALQRPVCPGCRTELASGLLVCPSCRRLVHGAELKELASNAERASQEGRTTEALGSYRQALVLLPAESRQHQAISERIQALLATSPSIAGDGGAKSNRRGWGLAGLGAIAVFFLTKGKLLVGGLASWTTLVSMFATVGVYWGIWGWWFAVGIVASIYVHEIGHVAAMRARGLGASAPMFVPGLGAFVRLGHRPIDAREDARIGLAGPLWGMGAAVACLLLFAATGNKLFAALAHWGALINAFNLVPIGSLDGDRGFRALARGQRIAVALLFLAPVYVTGERLWFLPAIVAAWRCFGRDLPSKGDRRTLGEFALLVSGLSVLAYLGRTWAGTSAG